MTRPTVLVVDDEPALLNLARFVLERAGYDVLTAADGPAAVARFTSADRVTAVILDVNLPGLSGWQVLAALRRHRPGVRVILSSGNGHTDGEAADLPNAFLDKPFRPAELAAVVARVVADG